MRYFGGRRDKEPALIALRVENEALKQESDMLLGKEPAVHLGAQAALSAVRQMEGLRRERDELAAALYRVVNQALEYTDGCIAQKCEWWKSSVTPDYVMGLDIKAILDAHDAALTAEKDKQIADLTTAMESINAIRNSIIGRRTMNWSMHVYPLVAVLNATGFKGEGYEVARKKAKEENAVWGAALVGPLVEAIQAALSALGTGDCRICKCDGCKIERKEAIEILDAALAAHKKRTV
ncbi:MAG: hypothetical protein V1790_17395 [Planctomycetota bacterium]